MFSRRNGFGVLRFVTQNDNFVTKSRNSVLDRREFLHFATSKRLNIKTRGPEELT